LYKHNILNKSQYGFKKNKSTKDDTASIMENITENPNNKMKYNCVLLDLLKAFHCTEHNIRMNKLYQYGVLGIPYKLIVVKIWTSSRFCS
jgi:hypothetical protein